MLDNERTEDTVQPLKTILELGARVRPEIPERQASAYADIMLNLQCLLQTGRLSKEETPGIYVYEISHSTYRQTGIWALTALSDYTGGTIKTHELTFADSVRRLKNYREHTGLEGSPVLLTYIPDITVNRIIAETRANHHGVTLGNEDAKHTLWKIEDETVCAQLIGAFAGIKSAYLADGHHRFASSARLAGEQSAQGLPVFDAISSLYIATDQLHIQEYDRVYLPEQAIDKNWLLSHISCNFTVEVSPGNQPVHPDQMHQIGMLIDGAWYRIAPKPHTYQCATIAGNLDAAILQGHLLAPVFNVADPGTDKRLKYIGGGAALDELLAFTGQNPAAIAFTLCPLSVEQLMAVADAGEILPPKSTWIDPKVPYGLLLYQHQV
ncbi:MAG: DUF1015 family protein [Mucilaginibacter sp.]